MPEAAWGGKMETYTGFAGVYDIFMDDTPYEEWASYLDGLLKKYGVRRETGADRTDERAMSEEERIRSMALAAERNVVVDLGCGTGTLTELLADQGYDMIGIDNSEEMLQIAREKKEKSGNEILYLLQDMRELELYGTVGAVVSVCDSLNYLLEEEDIVEVFRLVNNYLYPGGVFIFDFNTVYKYETVIGDCTIAENREDCSFIWENYYDAREQMNEYDLTIFIKTEAKGGEGEERFRRFTETHYQRGYTLGQMRRMVEESGLEFVAAVDADSHEEVKKESGRIYVIARECGKSGVE